MIQTEILQLELPSSKPKYVGKSQIPTLIVRKLED